MLTEAVESYLAIRRAVGFDLEETERLLGMFTTFAVSRGDTHVRAETVLEWAGQGATIAARHCRLRRVVLFARHVHAEDQRHEVPPGDVYRRPPKQLLRPHIYSHEEEKRMFAFLGRLGPKGSLRPHTYTTLFGLLFSTGMRISEALALRFENVTAEGLLILGTKFRKRRFIPLHDTAKSALSNYIALRRTCRGNTDHIFVNMHGLPLRYPAVAVAFRRLRKRVGLSRPRGEQQPRIHDIRHTFAVRALEASPDDRDHIGQHMLALTTYLGHSNVADTFWYLHATPRLMTDIADAYQALLSGGRA